MELLRHIRIKLDNLETQHEEELKEYDENIEINGEGESTVSFWNDEANFNDLQKILNELSEVNNSLNIYPTKIQKIVKQIHDGVKTFMTEKGRRDEDYYVKYNNGYIEVMTSFWYATTIYYKYNESTELLCRVKIESFSNTKARGSEKVIGKDFEESWMDTESVIEEVIRKHH